MPTRTQAVNFNWTAILTGVMLLGAQIFITRFSGHYEGLFTEQQKLLIKTIELQGALTSLQQKYELLEASVSRINAALQVMDVRNERNVSRIDNMENTFLRMEKRLNSGGRVP